MTFTSAEFKVMFALRLSNASNKKMDLTCAAAIRKATYLKETIRNGLVKV